MEKRTTTINFSLEDMARIGVVKKYYSLNSMTAVLSFLLNKENKLILKAKKNE